MYRQIDATRGVSPCSYLVPSPPYRLARQSQATHWPDLRSRPVRGASLFPQPQLLATPEPIVSSAVRVTTMYGRIDAPQAAFPCPQRCHGTRSTVSSRLFGTGIFMRPTRSARPCSTLIGQP
ncbi:hypothetical protein NEOLEDRAFT_1143889, partial [Neolentinus lepideus HHB14362 ss-1]